MAIAILVGPAVIGAVDLIASAFAIIVKPESSLALRIVLYAGWLLVSTLVVLALREPIFMLRARDFIRSMPIKRHAHFASDISAIAVAYSFLWAPIAYFIWEVWSGKVDRPKWDASSALLIGILLGIVVQVMALHISRRTVLLLLFSTFLYSAAPSLEYLRWPAYVASLSLAALSVVRDYERRPSSAKDVAAAIQWRAAVPAWHAGGPLAFRVLAGDLRHAMGLRLAVVLGALCFSTWLAAQEYFCNRGWGAYLVQLGVVVVALHRLPALTLERLIQAMPFIYRLRKARMQEHVASLGLVFLVYGSVAALTAFAWRQSCDSSGLSMFRAAWGAVGFASILIALNTLAYLKPQSSTWVGIISVLTGALLFGQLL